MRKRYINILATCATVLLAAACGSKEQTQPSEPEPDALEEMTIEAEVATRTVMNTDNTVDWSVSDAISVFSTSHRVNHSFGSSHSAVSHLTTFSGKIERGTTEVLALYPYTASAAYSGSTVTGMSIPTTQTATESSFANGASVTIAKGTKAAEAKTVVLLFDNLCSVLKFTVPEGIKQSSSIRVESIDSNVKMSGAVTIDPATKAITSATASYVDLSGSFTAGKTYCVTVAPGNYDQGFRFTINGSGGNTLVREAPAVNAEKGKVYNVGALNPVISSDPVTCSISHIYENNTLTGTNATVTLSAPQNEFASNIKRWRLDNVTIKSQDGTVLYRTLANTSSTNGQALTLLQASGKPYIPHGNYTFSADIYYTVNKADGTPAEKLYQANFTKTVTSPAPDASKFTLDANISGYTSYNYGTGTDKTKNVDYANNLSPTRIYEIAATYKSGLSAGVFTQCQSLLSVVPTLDGDTFSYDTADGKGSGNQKGSQSWASHTLGAKLSFDGSTQKTCATTRTVYITGLPYNATPPQKSVSQGDHKWREAQGNITWNTNHVYMVYSAAKFPGITSPDFYIPVNINVKARGNINVITNGGSHDLNIKCGGTDHKFDKGSRAGDAWPKNGEEVNETMTSDKKNWTIMYNYAAWGPETYIYSFIVEYR